MRVRPALEARARGVRRAAGECEGEVEVTFEEPASWRDDERKLAMMISSELMLISCLGAAAVMSSDVAPPAQPAGSRVASFVGTVHPSILPVAGGATSDSVQSFFGFGTTMMYNTDSEGGMTLRQSAEFHCRNISVNQVSMLIAPPTEGGVISNPADTDPWVPAHSSVGMVQAAARFSQLARSTCPQATGVVIDDFLQQYIGRNDTSGCVNASCPASQPFRYGDSSAGVYCCPHKNSGGDCDRPACKAGPSHTDCACCLVAGSSEGCQGATRCAGHPQGDKPACPLRPQITLADMKEIKAAVQGKTVRADGTVDHASAPLTPHLTLGIVWYDFELVGNYEWVKQDGLLDVIDVVTPWVWHQSAAATANYSALISTLREYVGPDMPLFPGVYVKNSAIGWCATESVENLITQTATMYDAGANHPSVRADRVLLLSRVRRDCIAYKNALACRR